jgi:hypothetical protein
VVDDFVVRESGPIAVSSKQRALQLRRPGPEIRACRHGYPNGEFNALVGDLITTLNKFTVGRREQSELLSVLSPMGQDIVERQQSPSKKEV